MTDRHWTAGTNMPPADHAADESRDWPHQHMQPEDLFPLDVRPRPDLERETASKLTRVAVAFTIAGGFWGAVITWAVMR